MLRVSLSLRLHQNALLYLPPLAAGCAACDGCAMGRQTKYVSELWLIVSMLSSLRNGSRKHAAYVPEIAALHCSIELKLQFRAKL